MAELIGSGPGGYAGGRSVAVSTEPPPPPRPFAFALSRSAMTSVAITPYLQFAGRADEAIAFYRAAAGAELGTLMRFRESPAPPPPGMLQPGFEDKVMHAELRIGGALLMLSDGCDDRTRMSGFSLALTVPSEAEARRAFDRLADGGTVMMPLCQTFWSPCFGMLTDRFGVSWMVMVPAI